MAFKKGDPNINRSGRKAGSKNRAGKKAKEFVERLITDKSVTREVKRQFLDLEGRELLKAYSDLLRFVIPTQKEGTFNIETDLNRLGDEQLNELYERIIENIHGKQ